MFGAGRRRVLHRQLFIGLLLLLAPLALCQAPATQPALDDAPAAQVAREAAALERRTWTVDQVERVALVHVPRDAGTKATPVVFAFHGHGGNARNASRMFRMHELWPEALVVYMEGLPTPGALTDPDGKLNGWQNREGQQNDRDLKFFDAVLATLRKDYKVDERRVYAMGHSNGGGFTYLLWLKRPDVFAAFAPSGAFSLEAKNLKPKPAMHIAGKNDDLVKFQYQERMMAGVRKINGCAEQGREWAKDCTLYESPGGTPLVTYIYDGTHKYPNEAPELVVRFLKGQAQPEKDGASDKR